MIYYIIGKQFTFINLHMLKSEAYSSTQGICFRSHINPDKNDVKQANRFFDTKCCKHMQFVCSACVDGL